MSSSTVPAFAMTINTSQGQILDSVGSYVALSRAKRPQDVKILIDPQISTVGELQGTYTINVAYTEVQ
jgi:hypothetical protein